MAPAPVKEPGDLLSDRRSPEQTCQAQQKYKKESILLYMQLSFPFIIVLPWPVISLRWGSQPVCRASQTALCPPDPIHYAIFSLLHCKSRSGVSCFLTFLIFDNNHLKEYERAVIFRLGRLVTGGARGPGVFFVIPCLDVYEKIDMRTSTYDVPPQEVRIKVGWGIVLREMLIP